MFLKKENFFLFIFFIIFFVFSSPYWIKKVYAALSCTVTTSCANTTIWKMSATDNAHSELASQSNYIQLVCCSGPSGLSTTCSGNYQIAVKISGTTNAHAEQNTQSNYANNVCLSSSSGTFTIAYQASNCTGYDTTIASISGTTNAHAGDSSAYTTKICGSHSSSSGAFNVYASSSASFDSSLSVLFTSQTSTLTKMGAVKIEDDRGTGAGWTVNLTSNDWKTTTEAMQLDYDGTGSNGNLGKLCTKPNDGTLYAESGSLTGVSKGDNDCFSSGVSTIDFVTATSGNGNGTYWLTDVSLGQFIPSGPTAAVYTTTMVLTLQ